MGPLGLIPPLSMWPGRGNWWLWAGPQDNEQGDGSQGQLLLLEPKRNDRPAETRSRDEKRMERTVEEKMNVEWKRGKKKTGRIGRDRQERERE